MTDQQVQVPRPPGGMAGPPPVVSMGGVAQGVPPPATYKMVGSRVYKEEGLNLEDITERFSTELVPPVVISMLPPPPGMLRVHIVGCGGTGARLAPLVIKQMREGDTLTLWDDDVVEEWNLRRQHFLLPHLGMNKAEVVGMGVASEAKRLGVTLEVESRRLTHKDLGEAIGREPNDGYVVFGCVDSKMSRIEINIGTMGRNGGRVAWIDAGNEDRGGQVILNLNLWPIREMTLPSGVHNYEYTPRNAHETMIGNWARALRVVVQGISEIVPSLLTPEAPAGPDVGGTCPLRIDTQTIPANILATAYQAAMFSWIMGGIPCSTAGIFYSTIGATSTVPMTRYVESAQRIVTNRYPT